MITHKQIETLLKSLSESEWKYLYFMLMGYKGFEIAYLLGVSSARVSEIRKSLKRKVENICGVEAVGLQNQKDKGRLCCADQSIQAK